MLILRWLLISGKRESGRKFCPKAEYDNLGTNITVAKSCELDVKDFVGKNLVIAIAYNKEGRPNPSVNGKNATTQLKYYFDSMNIENLLRNNNVTHQYAGESCYCVEFQS